MMMMLAYVHEKMKKIQGPLGIGQTPRNPERSMNRKGGILIHNFELLFIMIFWQLGFIFFSLSRFENRYTALRKVQFLSFNFIIWHLPYDDV